MQEDAFAAQASMAFTEKRDELHSWASEERGERKDEGNWVASRSDVASPWHPNHRYAVIEIYLHL